MCALLLICQHTRRKDGRAFEGMGTYLERIADSLEAIAEYLCSE